jgi:hypothetical protein
VALRDSWVQEILNYECSLEDPTEWGDDPGSDSGDVGRAAIDGTIVVYDPQDVPTWLQSVLDARDEDGNTVNKEAP